MPPVVITLAIHSDPFDAPVIPSNSDTEVVSLSVDASYWPPEANAPEARLLILEGYFLFAHRWLPPRRLRQILFPPNATRAYVVLSFLPEELLGAYPCAALLDQPGVVFRRLPCSRSEIDKALRSARMFTPNELTGMAQRFGTVIGQAQWSARRFRERLHSTPEDPSVLRQLAELRRFCQHRWPHYFRSVFSELDEAMQVRNAERVCQAMDTLLERIIPAFVYESFAPFFHSEGKDVNNKGPGPTLAALSAYIVSPSMTSESIASYLREHQWWDEFSLSLGNVRQQLDEVRLAGFDPDKYLPVRFEDLEDALSAFTEFADAPVSQASDSGICKAHEHLTVLIDGIAAIADARAFLWAQDQRPATTEGATAQEIHGEVRRMLFVDDDYTHWSPILEGVAQQHNWDVVSVGSIEAGRKELDQNKTKYSLILLDLGFPNQDVQGCEGVRLLHDTARGIPIIVLTASNSAADIRTAVACLNQGAWEYFTKPNVDWLQLMREAHNLAIAGRLIRNRTQTLSAVAEPLNTRVMFYVPIPKGQGLISGLKEWLADTYGGATVHETKVEGVWQDEGKAQVTDSLVLLWSSAKMIEQIEPTQAAIFEKARDLLGQMPGEKCLGVEVGTVFYLVYPDEIRVNVPLETARIDAGGGSSRMRVSKWPAS